MVSIEPLVGGTVHCENEAGEAVKCDTTTYPEISKIQDAKTCRIACNPSRADDHPCQAFTYLDIVSIKFFNPSLSIRD
jgi:hypothetical protein